MQQLRPRAARALPNVTQHVSACPLEAHLTLPRTTSKTVRSSPKGYIPSSLQGLHLGLSPKSAQAGLPVLPRHLLAMWPHRADGSSMSQEANLQRGRRQGEPRRSGTDRALPKALCPCLPTSSSGGGKARGTPALDRSENARARTLLPGEAPLASPPAYYVLMVGPLQLHRACGSQVHPMGETDRLTLLSTFFR